VRICKIGLGLLVLAVGLVPLARAQQEERSVTLALPEYIIDLIDQETFRQFEADHPGVAASVPTPAPDEVAITFGLFGLPMSSDIAREQIQPVVDEFLANDPEVKHLVLDTQISVPPNEWSEATDCFYTAYFSSGYEDLNILSLDPFLDADPDFDRGDVFDGVLTQLQSGNRTWGLPMTLEPSILTYDPDVFARAGVPLPDPMTGWTSDHFIDALHQLKNYLPVGTVPFQPETVEQGDHLLMLIAAFGGLPLDHRVTPATVNFTAPETVKAIRQALDLAREGYMDYAELANMMGGGGGDAIYSEPEVAPLVTTTGLFMFDFFMDQFADGKDSTRRPVTYPRGSRYTPVMYQVGAGYISANAPNPEACYRWLSHLAQYPHLLSGMPVRRAQLDDPVLEAARGSEEMAFYRQFDAVLQSPGVVVFGASGRSNYSYYFTRYWLYEAFDAYVLEDADLELVLAEAETKALTYLTCAADIPPTDYGLDDETIQAQSDQYIDCALAADPALAEWLRP
jgi:ABC-type glycerol-3-phosphate transport system substrate-binding protein